MPIVDSSGQPTVEIPEHLKEGWEAFEQWRVAREQAGIPLPPGARFVVNKGTVLKDSLGRYRLSIAQRLKLPMSAVKVDLDWDDAGRLNPITNVDPPEGWVENWTGGQGGTRVEEYAREHIRAVVKEQYQALQQEIVTRIAGLEHTRPDLLQPVEDCLAEEAQKTTDPA